MDSAERKFAKSIIQSAQVSNVTTTATATAHVDAVLLDLAKITAGEVVAVYCYDTGDRHEFIAIAAQPGSGIVALPRSAGFRAGQSVDIVATLVSREAPANVAFVECDEDTNRMMAFDEVDLAGDMAEMLAAAYGEADGE